MEKLASGWRRHIQVTTPAVAAAAAAALAISLSACSSPVTTAKTLQATNSPSQSPQASAIAAIVRKGMKTYHLRAVIVRVTRGDKVVTTQAFGPSMTGVPATPAMHFRNGAIAFAYVATLLMEYVDEHKVSLSDTINRWVPSLPEASKVTLKMLANQTSGYPDFETDPAWTAAFNADPFQIFTYKERLGYAFRRPVQFPPGKNWSYAHTNFMILGHILSMIGKKPLATLLRQKVLKPMGLTGTTSSETSAMPNPVLHSFSSEREVALHIPPKVTFYEEVDPAEPAAERLELHRGLSPRPEDRDRRGRDLRTRGVQFGRGGARRQRPDLPVDRRLPGPQRPAAHEEMTHDVPRVAGLRFHYVVLTGRRQ